MKKSMSSPKRKGNREALTLVPLYLFTLLFLVGPLVYMVVLSFMTRAETWGVLPEFTLENYRDIGEPVYLETFWESLKLAVVTTLLVPSATPWATLWQSSLPSGSGGSCCC